MPLGTEKGWRTVHNEANQWKNKEICHPGSNPGSTRTSEDNLNSVLKQTVPSVLMTSSGGGCHRHGGGWVRGACQPQAAHLQRFLAQWSVGWPRTWMIHSFCLPANEPSGKGWEHRVMCGHQRMGSYWENPCRAGKGQRFKTYRPATVLKGGTKSTPTGRCSVRVWAQKLSYKSRGTQGMEAWRPVASSCLLAEGEGSITDLTKN